MKHAKQLFCGLALCLLMLGFSACSGDSQPVECDESDLVGLWYNDANPQEFWRYYPNGDGYTWDESEDVHENEAQVFEWTLEDGKLTQYHIISISGSKIPKGPYTIVEMSRSHMAYKDSYKKISFTRVSDH